MGHRLGKIGVSGGSIPRAFVMVTGEIGRASLGEMSGHEFRLAFGYSGKVLLQRPRHPFVDLLTLSSEPIVVSYIPQQRMFEAIAGCSGLTLGKRQSCVNEARNSCRDLTRGRSAHRLQ